MRVCVCVKLRVSNAGNVSLHKRGDPTAYLPFSLSYSLWLLLSAFLYSAAINVIGTGFCLANKRRFDPCSRLRVAAIARCVLTAHRFAAVVDIDSSKINRIPTEATEACFHRTVNCHAPCVCPPLSLTLCVWAWHLQTQRNYNTCTLHNPFKQQFVMELTGRQAECAAHANGPNKFTLHLSLLLLLWWCKWLVTRGQGAGAGPTQYYVAWRLVHKANADLACSRSYE